MSAKQRTDWFWSDWLGDQAVRRLTPGERGVWIDLLALAAVGTPVGYVCDEKARPLPLEEIARVTNVASRDELAEIINGILEKGAASRDRSGRLFNRRMVRDSERAAKQAVLSAKRAQAGYRGAAHTSLKYFDKQILPRQEMQQLPGHVPRLPLVSSSKRNKKILTTELGATNSCANGVPADPEQEAIRAKRPSEVSRLDLDQLLARRNGGG